MSSFTPLDKLNEITEEVLLSEDVLKDNEIIIDKTDAFVSQLMLIFFYSLISCCIQILGYFFYYVIYLRLLTNGHKINQILSGNKTLVNHALRSFKKTE